MRSRFWAAVYAVIIALFLVLIVAAALGYSPRELIGG